MASWGFWLRSIDGLSYGSQRAPGTSCRNILNLVPSYLSKDGVYFINIASVTDLFSAAYVWWLFLSISSRDANMSRYVSIYIYIYLFI